MRYKVINQTFPNSGNGDKSWETAFITGGNRDQGSIFRYETPKGAAIVPCHNFKEKSGLLRSLGMPISDLINLCYNQAKSIGIN